MNYKVIAVVAIVTFIILQIRSHLKHKKLEQRLQCLEPAIIIKPVKVERIRTIQEPRDPGKAISLDATKRKSLMPSNQNAIPAGFKEVSRNMDGEVIAFLEKRLPTSFQHNFFGSNLVVNGHICLSGLTHKLHVMEVDENNQVTIDGALKQLHPDVIEAIREQARR